MPGGAGGLADDVTFGDRGDEIVTTDVGDVGNAIGFMQANTSTATAFDRKLRRCELVTGTMAAAMAEQQIPYMTMERMDETNALTQSLTADCFRTLFAVKKGQAQCTKIAQGLNARIFI